MALSYRVEESLLLVFEDVRILRNVKSGLEIVLVGRIFVESAYQVRDGRGEIVVARHGCVEHYVATTLGDRQRLGARHSFEHLDVKLFQYAAFTRHVERPRHVKEVVASNAHAKRLPVLRTQ